MGVTYVPQTNKMEQNPWQIEVVNILSRSVNYLCPILSLEEYAQVRSKKNALHPTEYIAKVNKEFYPAYKEVVETIGMLIEADPGTFLLTGDLVQHINVLHHIVVVEWAEKMCRCRVGPVREMVNALKTFSQKGHEAMTYLVSRKPYLTQLYNQVFHIKYESCDHAMIEELCKIIRAKVRNPENEKHLMWLARVEQALQDIARYDTQMSGWAHGNKYKPLPTDLMREMLQALQNNPISNEAVKFAQIQLLLSHHIRVDTVSDLYVSNNSDKPSVFSQFRGEWWMCPDNTVPSVAVVPAVPLIALHEEEVSSTANIAAVLGDTYRHFELARLFSNDLASLREFVRDHYKFHVEWFEETTLAAGLPGGRTYPHHEREALCGVVQRLVCALVEDGADRGDRARDIVYGPVLALPHSSDVVISEFNRPL